VNAPAVKERLGTLGASPIASSPQELEATIRPTTRNGGRSSRRRESSSNDRFVPGRIGLPMITACLPPLEPTRPNVPPPAGACDTHAHVFGPRPVSLCRRPQLHAAGCAVRKYLKMLDTIGFTRALWCRQRAWPG